MRLETVVVVGVRLHDVVQQPQTEAEQVVQTLPLQAADPRLREAICLRHPLHPVRPMLPESFASSIAPESAHSDLGPEGNRAEGNPLVIALGDYVVRESS